MSKILFTERPFNPQTPITLERAGFEVFIPKEELEGVHEFDREALIATLKEIQPQILFVKLTHKINRELIELAPIKIIATQSTGLDLIDIDYCNEKNIQIVSLRGSDLYQIKEV